LKEKEKRIIFFLSRSLGFLSCENKNKLNEKMMSYMTKKGKKKKLIRRRPPSPQPCPPKEVN
jgi:hypothetical protein